MTELSHELAGRKGEENGAPDQRDRGESAGIDGPGKNAIGGHTRETRGHERGCQIEVGNARQQEAQLPQESQVTDE